MGRRSIQVEAETLRLPVVSETVAERAGPV